MPYPTVSIITPSYNQGNFIAETMSSVLSQAGEFYLDYIVRDGGSTDGSVETIRHFHDQVTNGEVVLLRHGVAYHKPLVSAFARCLGIAFRYCSGPDHGQVAAINAGLSLAQGDSMAYLNSDDVYYPQAISRALAYLPSADIVYGRGMWISRCGTELLEYPTFRPTIAALYWQCTLCQPTVFFSRQVLQALGPFSLSFGHVFDYEYWLRAIAAGCRFRYLAAWIARSRMYRENKSLSCRAAIMDEIAQVKSIYYRRAPSAMRKWQAWYRVHRPTLKAVRRLYWLLQQEPSTC